MFQAFKRNILSVPITQSCGWEKKAHDVVTLVEAEPGATGISVGSVAELELSGRASCYLWAELFAMIAMGRGSMHLEGWDLSLCVGRSVQCRLTPKQNCSLQFRLILENGGIDFPNLQKQNTIVKP